MSILEEKKSNSDRDPSGIDEIVNPLGGIMPSSIMPVYQTILPPTVYTCKGYNLVIN